MHLGRITRRQAPIQGERVSGVLVLLNSRLCSSFFLLVSSYIDQLNLILQTLGTPEEATLDRVGSERACQYIRSLPKSEKIPFAELFPKAEPAGTLRRDAIVAQELRTEHDMSTS